jgi:high-affinity iron transporter
MLIVTGLLLTVVLAIMVGKTVRTMQGVGWFPITPVDVDLPYWTGIWLGVFPTVETILAQIASVLFVLGSYVLAERLKHQPRGGAAQVATSAHSQPRKTQTPA